MDKADLVLVGKVLLFSLAISVLIKYGGSLLSFAPSNLNALIAISLPPLVIFLMLFWRRFGSSGGGSNLSQNEN